MNQPHTPFEEFLASKRRARNRARIRSALHWSVAVIAALVCVALFAHRAFAIVPTTGANPF